MTTAQRPRPPLVVIADDLTGASDAGLQFAKFGARTAVWIDTATAFGDVDVTVIDLDTRVVSPGVAAQRMRAALGALPPGATIVKKIDSTLRFPPIPRMAAFSATASSTWTGRPCTKPISAANF